MWVLVAIFFTGSGISTQQIGFYSDKAECTQDAASIESHEWQINVRGVCLPAKGTGNFE